MSQDGHCAIVLMGRCGLRQRGYQMTDKTKICFNTGRLYTKEGQVITAQFDPENNTVVFNDHSRMVCGKFSVTSFAAERIVGSPDYEFPRIVMRRYDSGDFDHGYTFDKDMVEVHRDDTVEPMDLRI